MQLVARARELESQGRSIIHMEVGEPDFPTPPAILQAGRQALAGAETRYTPACGLPELRLAVAQSYYGRDFGLDLDPARIVITPGASGALQLALAAVLDPGDEVLVTEPGYPCNANMAAVVGAVPKCISVGPESGWQPTLADLERCKSPRTKMLMLASPANPTGAILEPERFAQLHARCRELGIAVVVDEIYHRLVYDRPAHTALAQSDDLFIVNSFSKYFQMTGWRLGWLVAPTHMVASIDRLAQNLFLAPSTVAQWAAMAGFEPATRTLLEERRRVLAQRRDVLVAGLRKLGCRISQVPEGAFYVWADVGALVEDSESFARDLLEAGGVAITPGTDFCRQRGAHHLRLAYTIELDVMAQALERIAEHLDSSSAR